jgi:hypothetical protein
MTPHIWRKERIDQMMSQMHKLLELASLGHIIDLPRPVK